MQAKGEPPLTRPGSRPPRRIGILGVSAAVVFGADLATKTWVVSRFGDGHVTHLIPHVLDIQESRNAGAAFGLATGATIMFTLVAAAVAVVIVRESRRLRSARWAVALGLLLGGAVGNLGDRLLRSPGPLRGRVVDWIYLHHWPVFNVADSAIVVGGILCAVLATGGWHLDGSRERR